MSVALGVLSDFASISSLSLLLVIEYHGGKLLQAWISLINSAKVEFQAACIVSLAKILDQSDAQYLENERRDPTDTNAPFNSVFALPCKYSLPLPLSLVGMSL